MIKKKQIFLTLLLISLNIFPVVDPAEQADFTRLLLISIVKNEVGVVDSILNIMKIDPNIPDQQGNLPLVVAVQHNRFDMIQLLLAAGADINKPNITNATPLLLALHFKHDAIIDLLLAAGADVNKANNENITPLMVAADRGFLDRTKQFIAAGADVNHAKNNGDTPLIFAADRGFFEVAQELIAAGADVNKANELENAPLSLAAERGHANLVQLLINANANLNKQNQDGNTAVLLAADKNKPESLALLIKAGAHIDLADNFGHTPLVTALHQQFREIAKQLLDAGADPNTQDETRTYTTLLFAANTNNPLIAQDLLNAGAHINAGNNNNYTPLMLAADKGYFEMVDFFLKNKAEINAQTLKGDTALMFATNNKDDKIVNLLLTAGADASIKNLHGNTALMIAALKGNINTARKLVEQNHTLLTVPNNYGLTPLDIVRKLRKEKQITPQTLKWFEDKAGSYKSNLTPAQVSEIVQNLLAEEEEKQIIIEPQKQKRGEKFTVVKKKKKKKKPQVKKVEQSAQEDLPDTANSLEDDTPQAWLEGGINAAAAAGLLPDRSSPKSLVDITLSKTLQAWNQNPTTILEQYGYLGLDNPTDEQSMRNRIFKEINSILQDASKTQQAIINAHTVVPPYIMRYLIEYFPSVPYKNYAIIKVPMKIKFPDDEVELQGIYELFFYKKDTSYHVFHSLFKDNQLSMINFEEAQTERTESPSSSGGSGDELNEGAGTAIKRTQSNDWKTIPELAAPQKIHDEILFTDQKTGVIYTIPAPE